MTDQSKPWESPYCSTCGSIKSDTGYCFQCRAYVDQPETTTSDSAQEINNYDDN